MSKAVVQAALDALNARFAVMSLGSKPIVMEFDEDGKSLLRDRSFEDFKKLQIKNTVRVVRDGIPKVTAIGPLWLRSSKGRQYNQLVYDMPGSATKAGPSDYNGWLGYAVEPKAGDWSLNRSHWLNVLCGGDEEVYAWIFNWCAALIQQPGKHAFTALILHGGQGTGKGHFVHDTLGKLFYAQQYALLGSPDDLTGPFNEHLSGRVLVFADEASWGGNARATDRLKGLITSDTIRINRKFVAATFEPSALHIIIASNKERPVFVEKDDRRYCTLHVQNSKANDASYFMPLRAELEGGGRAALLHDLLQHEIDHDALKSPPNTLDKRMMKGLSLSPETEYLQGVLLNWDGRFQQRMSKTEFYDDYVVQVQKGGAARFELKGRDAFGKSLRVFFKRGADALGIANPLRDAKTTGQFGRVNAYQFPSLTECRRIFDAATGAHTDWPAVDEEQPALVEV